MRTPGEPEACARYPMDEDETMVYPILSWSDIETLKLLPWTVLYDTRSRIFAWLMILFIGLSRSIQARTCTELCFESIKLQYGKTNTIDSSYRLALLKLESTWTVSNPINPQCLLNRRSRFLTGRHAKSCICKGTSGVRSIPSGIVVRKSFKFSMYLNVGHSLLF